MVGLDVAVDPAGKVDLVERAGLGEKVGLVVVADLRASVGLVVDRHRNLLQTSPLRLCPFLAKVPHTPSRV